MYLPKLLLVFFAVLSLSAVENNNPAYAQQIEQKTEKTGTGSNAASGAREAPRSPAGIIAEDRSADPKEYKPQCQKPTNHDEADLCAQRSMAEAAQETLLWVKWQAIVGAVSLVFIVLSIAFSAWAARAAALAAKEAAKGNKINLDATNLEQRAWLDIDLVPQGVFRIDAFGSVMLPVAIRIKNIGKSPAHNINTDVKMDCIGRHTTYQRNLAEFASPNDDADPDQCRSLMPGRSYDREWTALDDGTGRDVDAGQIIMPTVYICVRYETVFADGVHTTASAFTLGLKDDGDGFFPIPYNTGDIPALKIDVIPSGASIID